MESAVKEVKNDKDAKEREAERKLHEAFGDSCIGRAREGGGREKGGCNLNTTNERAIEKFGTAVDGALSVHTKEGFLSV